MGFFENLGRKVGEFTHEAKQVADDEASYACENCGSRFHTAREECPECGSTSIVEREQQSSTETADDSSETETADDSSASSVDPEPDAAEDEPGDEGTGQADSSGSDTDESVDTGALIEEPESDDGSESTLE